MSIIAKTLANQISARGHVIHFKNNSVFEALEAAGSDETMRTISQAFATKINNELILIKNKLRPFMNELIDSVKVKVDETSGNDGLAEYNVSIFVPSEVLTELKDKKIIMERRTPVSLVEPLVIPSPSAEEVEKFFIHSDKVIDSGINTLRQKYGVNGMLAIWDKYFSNVSESNPNINSMGVNTLTKLDELLMVFVAADNLTSERPAGVGVSEEKYKELITNFYKEICNFLAITSEHMELIKKTKQLVINIQGSVILVDGDLYKEYLEEGGTPDALLGMIVSNKDQLKDFLYSSVLDHKEELAQAWVDFVKMKTFTHIEMDVSRFKTIYSIVLRDTYLNNIPQDLAEILEVEYETANAKLEDMLHGATKDYVLDPGLVCRDIVGKIMFPNTNFQHYAEHISEYVKLNPSFTAQDGATFAAVEYVVDFMVEQLFVGGLDGQEVVL